MSNTGNEPWITVAETDVDTYLAGPYMTALTTAALASGQADPFTPIMTDVVNLVRSAIRGGCVKNVTPIVVSQTPLTIPPDLRMHVLALIVEALYGRLAAAGLKLGADSIGKAADRAREYIERIQEGKATVTEPPDPMAPDDQQRGAPATVVQRRRRPITAERLRGL